MTEMWILQDCEWNFYESVGVFSSWERAADWLRRSRRFMSDGGGPVVPTPEGRSMRLNERFMAVPFEVDPEPLVEPDSSAIGGTA